MRSPDIVGYGNLLTLDGFRGKSRTLTDSEEVMSLLTDLGDLLDPGLAPRAHVENAEDGISAAVISAESQLTLHTFPAYERIAFRAFSRRILPVITLSERVRVRFGIGRIESQLRHRATLAPAREHMPMSRVLEGERAYARLRFQDVSTR